MALSIANAFKKACVDAGLALLNSGNFVLQTSGAVTLASLTFGSTAFAGATTASPSVAASNTITADTTVTAGTVGIFRWETSGAAAIISGTVGVGTGDLQVSDNVIPVGATQVSSSGVTFSLQIN